MKITALKLLLCLSLGFLVLSCGSSSNNDGDESPDFSDLPFDALLDGSVSYAIITLDEYDGDFEAYVIINIIEDHESVTMSIDGTSVELFGFGGSYFGDADLTPAQNLSLELTVDGSSTTGSITLPDMLQTSFPSEFDFNSDFTISWSIEDDPDYFVTQIDIDYDDDPVFDINLLNGNQRSHTFSQSIYSGLSWDDVWEVDVGVTAMNSQIIDGIVFIGAFDRYKWYPDDEEEQFARIEERAMPFARHRH